MRRSLPLPCVVLLACGNPATDDATDSDVDTEVGPVTSEADAQAARLACTYGAGALATETLATSAPKGSDVPIDHVVIVMQENHSFDSLFSKLGGDVTAAPDDVTLLDSHDQPVTRKHQEHLCVSDVDHSWKGSIAQLNDGANDGFVKVNDPDGARSLDDWDERDIPYYYALARAFAISDAHFCSLLGPTSPNRMFGLAGTSFGLTSNALPPTFDPDGKPYPNLFTRLDDAGVSWKYYVDSTLPEGAVFAATYVADQAHFARVADYLADAAAGTLPSVAFVEGRTTDNADNEDEHPPGNLQVGQRWTAGIVSALLASLDWPSSALFLTYDEHGGFYDSVPPPAACVPDDLAPKLRPDDPPGAFDRYGFRVPLLVVSPYARRGHVSHHVTDHTSVARFVEARFGLPAMTARDANADPLYDLFDFTHADVSVPELPAATLDPDGEAWCNAHFPPK